MMYTKLFPLFAVLVTAELALATECMDTWGPKRCEKMTGKGYCVPVNECPSSKTFRCSKTRKFCAASCETCPSSGGSVASCEAEIATIAEHEATIENCNIDYMDLDREYNEEKAFLEDLQMTTLGELYEEKNTNDELQTTIASMQVEMQDTNDELHRFFGDNCTGHTYDSAGFYELSSGAMTCNDVVNGFAPAGTGDTGETNGTEFAFTYCWNADGSPATTLGGLFNIMDLCPETCGTGCGHMLSEDLSDTDVYSLTNLYPDCATLAANAPCETNIQTAWMCPATCGLADGEFVECDYYVGMDEQAESYCNFFDFGSSYAAAFYYFELDDCLSAQSIYADTDDDGVCSAGAFADGMCFGLLSHKGSTAKCIDDTDDTGDEDSASSCADELAEIEELQATNAELEGTILNGSEINTCDLSGMSAFGSGAGQTYSGPDFSPPTNGGGTRNFAGVNLAGSNLANAVFDGLSLVGANLKAAELFRATFYGADLSGADLTDAYMRGAVVASANLTGASLANVDFTCTLTCFAMECECEFYSDLGGAILVGANLTGANFVGADVTGADFTGAIGANLTGATGV